MQGLRYVCKILFVSLFVLVFSSAQLKANETSFSFLHFTNKDGLPSSYVKSITQDQYGFIWLATRVSISRFDGTHYKSFPSYDNEGKEINIFSNQVFMYADTLLVARTNQGEYYYFSEKTESFYPYHLLNDLGVVQAIVPTGKGYWICQSDEIYFVDALTTKKTNFVEICNLYNLPTNIKIKNILYRDNILIALTGKNSILKFNEENRTVKSYKISTNLDENTQDLGFIDFENWIWLEDEFNGLARIDLENGKVIHFSNEEKNPHFIPHNMVHCYVIDKQRRIWIGTEAGVTIYDPVLDESSVCRYDLSNSGGLNTDPIYDAFCDNKGNIWLGSYFGGVNFWSSESTFFKTWESGSAKWQLGGNVVSCFAEDEESNLWIGFEDLGLNYLNRTTGEIKRFSNSNGANGLSYNNLHDLLLLDNKELWIAIYTGGINVLDTETGSFRYINRKNTPELNSDLIYKLTRVGDSIFIGTTLGINVYDIKTKRFSKFKHDVLGNYQFESITQTKNTLWFSSVSAVYCYNISNDSLYIFNQIARMKNINFVKSDSKGNIWIGDCYQGICNFDVSNNKATFFNMETGFPASWIFSLEEGEDGWYWASSDKGLINFHPRLGKKILYDSNSGVPFNQFNFRASFTDKNKNIYFGGNNGMVSFNESVTPMLLKHTNVVFTGLQLFNNPISPGENSPLEASINTIERLKLKYDQNVITIEFSGLTYTLSGRCHYAYYLEGFEEDWNYVGNRDFATYTNLSPGKYTFHVKGSTNNVANETNERTLQIVVQPPFWFSKWAFLVYFVLAWLFSILLYRIGKYLEKSRSMVELERREKEHAEEIHKVKLEFFTNISHELKTPLTLILGPINRIIEEEKLSPASQKRLLGIEKNAKRLFSLIDQLLEFRKIENGKEKLVVGNTEVIILGEEIVKAFENIVESRDIEFVTSFPDHGKMAWIDGNKIDKVIFNLLSNAFKFTPAGGKIEFHMKLVKKVFKSKNAGENLIITISDTGKGIKADMLNKVFERFFQIDGGIENQHSSGIGLAYVKNLVTLHKGEISVESDNDCGTVFTVKIPASKTDYEKSELQTTTVQIRRGDLNEVVVNEPVFVSNEIDVTGLSRNPVIMLVEDNTELIAFMKEILESKYQIIIASNGVEALEKIEKLMPELIVSDIMMPLMDGFELTIKLKSNLQTSHIPVILLTAKSGVDNHLKGLNSGADYYIEKPFSPNVLEKNIENIISTRKKLIDRFKNDAYVPVVEVAASESDKIFIEKITSIIKNNLSDSTMDVTYLVKEMGLSRSLLHMKLKGLVNCSTTEYIRAIRLKEAVKLISNGTCNISEAAYEVGFSSPTYFTRRFKECYGTSPREFFNLKA